MNRKIVWYKQLEKADKRRDVSMVYEEFKEIFKEEIVEYLPRAYHHLLVDIETKEDKFKGTYDIIHFTDDRHPDAQLPSFNLTGVYQSVKERLNEDSIVNVFAEFAEELGRVLNASYKENGIDETVTSIEKVQMIYQVTSDNLQQVLDSPDFLQKLAEDEMGDLIIIPFDEQMIIVPKKEIPEDLEEDFLVETENFIQDFSEKTQIYFYQKDEQHLGMIQKNKGERLRGL